MQIAVKEENRIRLYNGIEEQVILINLSDKAFQFIKKYYYNFIF